MTNKTLLYFIFLLLGGWICIHSASAQPALPKHEVRAAWVTAAYGLDWPDTRAVSEATLIRQQEELTDILDKLQEANFNTVLFQTWMRGDLVYPSSIEPFSYPLAGRTGRDPGYDPLAFAIEECHKRGMECHAWIVAIPLGNRKHVANMGAQSVTRKRPAICVQYKNEWFLNPGHPATKEYLMDIVREVITRYDIDGVHFDYLRYPERSEKKFPDTREFRAYGKGKTEAEWRRENLTAIVRHLYHETKKIKPWVKVSTSPVGKHSDTSFYSSKGWNAFHTVYQDVDRWLAEGIHDQVYPMLYFRGYKFYPFVLDWQERSRGTQTAPGFGGLFLDPREGNWELSDIQRQLSFLREHHTAGAGFYRVRYLMDNTQGVYDLVKENFYRAPALQPPMTWLDSIPPGKPEKLEVSFLEEGKVELRWSPSMDNDSIHSPYYIVYGSASGPVDTSNPEHILAQRIRSAEYTYIPILPWERKYEFAVSAVDRYGNESDPLFLTDKDPGTKAGSGGNGGE